MGTDSKEQESASGRGSKNHNRYPGGYEVGPLGEDVPKAVRAFVELQAVGNCPHLNVIQRLGINRWGGLYRKCDFCWMAEVLAMKRP